ncbi:hypothetical protein LTR37_002822 [Vermiconidia calcicola]|uniref:Uncharacterized protein n=1 Tax=Vermiconidia calcicola TaxID=1690605 RepID=A0ACC3NSH0_9PEZI|nr:hypothetical protein LTR37_002822 [Vermiconidia calcicola]
MSRRACLILSVWLFLALVISCVAQAKPDRDEGLETYVSRPDIVSPKWQVQIHDTQNIAPGYWFLSPYDRVGRKAPGGAWIGPHIYDGQGGLIWSGSYIFNNRNVMDFTLSRVRGQSRLTAIFPPGEYGPVINHHYQVLDKLPVGKQHKTLNMHDLHFVEGGKTLMLLTRNTSAVTTAEQAKVIGYDAPCHINSPGFKDIDTTTWDTRFAWDARDIIPLDDSTHDHSPLKDRCAHGWDYMHANAVDKFDDGHYLLSARHADTLYKLDKDDGHMIWRLGGRKSDFGMGDVNFTRQHHARLHSQNETHTIITIMDNAKGEDAQEPSSKWSRALMIALRTDVTPMTAELIRAIDHPHKAYSWRRGSHQVLDNGNSFVCWSEQALQSEHSPDGKILWEARLQVDWLGTYRATKHEFIGLPFEPPAVHSQAFSQDDEPNNSTYTTVHVSWNGATEVATWALYKTDEAGGVMVRIASATRSGFETRIVTEGYSAFIIAQALDSEGIMLGESVVISTIGAEDMSTAAVKLEKQWLAKQESAWSLAQHVVASSIAAFLAGAIASAVGVLVIVVWRRRGSSGKRWWWTSRGVRYARVDSVDGEVGGAGFDEKSLDNVDVSGDRGRTPRQDDFHFATSEHEGVDNTRASGSAAEAEGRKL